MLTKYQHDLIFFNAVLALICADCGIFAVAIVREL
jgi:hypothetical protein